MALVTMDDVAAATEHTYRYACPSTVTTSPAGTDVVLSTSGGTTPAGAVEHPQFFRGFLANAEQTAMSLLAVAKVARTRYYVPPGMLAAVLRAADPVVTSSTDRLRFESFSACCGVYARLDLLAGALDAERLGHGTTNVDFNPPMREALAKVAGLDPLHVAVGEDVVVTTLDASVIERKVPLPQRWIKGFAEVQVVGTSMQPVLEVSAIEARRFIRSLPKSSASRLRMYAAPAGQGARLTGRPGPGMVPAAGAERLRILEPLLRFATGLRAYANPDSEGPSVWELLLPDARFVLTLSPDVSRGFSGEGGVLRDLADEQSSDDADLVASLLAFQSRIDIGGVARGAGLSLARARAALGRLGAAGRVGYDCAEAAYFHRDLPFDPACLETMHARLADARVLVADGALRSDPSDPTLTYVRSGGSEYRVRSTTNGTTCTCPWYAKHKSTRGPCKHIVATQLVDRREGLAQDAGPLPDEAG